MIKCKESPSSLIRKEELISGSLIDQSHSKHKRQLLGGDLMVLFSLSTGPLFIALAILFIDLFRKAANEKSFEEKVKIYSWLKENTSDTEGERSKTTQEVANGCNMDESQVVRFCYHHPYIYNPDGKHESWSIYQTNG